MARYRSLSHISDWLLTQGSYNFWCETDGNIHPRTQAMSTVLVGADSDRSEFILAHRLAKGQNYVLVGDASPYYEYYE